MHKTAPKLYKKNYYDSWQDYKNNGFECVFNYCEFEEFMDSVAIQGRSYVYKVLNKVVDSEGNRLYIELQRQKN